MSCCTRSPCDALTNEQQVTIHRVTGTQLRLLAVAPFELVSDRVQQLHVTLLRILIQGGDERLRMIEVSDRSEDELSCDDDSRMTSLQSPEKQFACRRSVQHGWSARNHRSQPPTLQAHGLIILASGPRDDVGRARLSSRCARTG